MRRPQRSNEDRGAQTALTILPLTPKTARRLLAARRGHDVAAERIVARIVSDVRRRGDAALLGWTRRLDGIELTPKSLWVTPQEWQSAHGEVSDEFLFAVEHAARNIRRVAQRQMPRSWSFEVESGVRVGQRVEPIETIGCYIPGGRFSLVSTLLMTVVPAQVAGVRRIIVTCPKPNSAILAAAGLLGIAEIGRVGGAQAIAALAFGTDSVPRVDKIFGPGNRYVTAAKKLVSTECAVDMSAGPTEVLIVATRGNPRFIAADLIAQAEHDIDAIAVLVTTSRPLALGVRSEIGRQLAALPPGNLARKSLAQNGAILLAPGIRAAVEFATDFAPEHLSLPGVPSALLRKIGSAGSVFLGPWSAQPIGDYACGVNHVLPTSGWARARGGLSAADFVKCASVQRLSRTGLRLLAPVARALAKAEGLTAHGRAVEVRQ